MNYVKTFEDIRDINRVSWENSRDTNYDNNKLLNNIHIISDKILNWIEKEYKVVSDYYGSKFIFEFTFWVNVEGGNTIYFKFNRKDKENLLEVLNRSEPYPGFWKDEENTFIEDIHFTIEVNGLPMENGYKDNKRLDIYYKLNKISKDKRIKSSIIHISTTFKINYDFTLDYKKASSDVIKKINNIT